MKSFLEFYNQIKEEAPPPPQPPAMIQPAQKMQQPVQKMQQPATGQQQAQNSQKQANVNPDVEKQLQQIIAAPNMENFISQLQKAISNPEFLNMLKQGDGEKDKITVQDATIPANSMVPTQKQIYLQKSLDNGISNFKGSLPKLLSGDSNAIPGAVIVAAVSPEGYAIIDGHHRWSQYITFNPDSKVPVKILGNMSNSLDALKKTQLALTAKSNTVYLEPEESGMIDMMEIDEKSFKDYAKNKLQSAGTLPIFQQYGHQTEDDVVNFLWQNVQALKSLKSKQQQANIRDVMPQTGKPAQVSGWEKDLQAGALNIVPDWLVLSGVVIRD